MIFLWLKYFKFFNLVLTKNLQIHLVFRICCFKIPQIFKKSNWTGRCLKNRQNQIRFWWIFQTLRGSKRAHVGDLQNIGSPKHWCLSLSVQRYKPRAFWKGPCNRVSSTPSFSFIPRATGDPPIAHGGNKFYKIRSYTKHMRPSSLCDTCTCTNLKAQ
jgi:hypothetical protein